VIHLTFMTKISRPFTYFHSPLNPSVVFNLSISSTETSAIFSNRFKSFHYCHFNFKFLQLTIQQLFLFTKIQLQVSSLLQPWSKMWAHFIPTHCLFSPVFCLHLAPAPFKNTFHSSTFQLPIIFAFFSSFLPWFSSRFFQKYLSQQYLPTASPFLHFLLFSVLFCLHQAPAPFKRSTKCSALSGHDGYIFWCF